MDPPREEKFPCDEELEDFPERDSRYERQSQYEVNLRRFAERRMWIRIELRVAEKRHGKLVCVQLEEIPIGRWRSRSLRALNYGKE